MSGAPSNWAALPADLLRAVFGAASPPRKAGYPRGPYDTVLSFEERIQAEVRDGTQCMRLAA